MVYTTYLKSIPLFFILSLLLSACSYGAPQIQTEIINGRVYPHPSQTLFAVATVTQTVRPPEGIAKFPNGGVPLVDSISGIVWIGNVETQEMNALPPILPTKQVRLSFSLRVAHWDGDWLTVQASGLQDGLGKINQENYRIKWMDPTATWETISSSDASDQTGNNPRRFEIGTNYAQIKLKFPGDDSWTVCCEVVSETGAIQFKEPDQ